MTSSKAQNTPTVGRPRNNSKQVTSSPLKQLRLNAKLSQEELAKLTGVAVSTVRRWEKGAVEPTMTVAQMRNFCKAVQRNFEDLPESLKPETR